MIASGEISFYLILFFTLAATALIAFYQFLDVYVLPSIENRKLKAFFSTWTFRSQLLLWIVFILYFVYQFILASPLYTLFVLTASIALGWKFWKNLISGVLFKIEQKAGLGDTIEWNGQQGEIIKIGHQKLIIQKENGEQVIIPHNKLTDGIFKIRNGIKHKKSIVLLIEKEKADRFGNLDEFQKFLENNPWAAPKSKAMIMPKEGGKLEVHIEAQLAEDRDRLENYLRSEIERKSSSTLPSSKKP